MKISGSNVVDQPVAEVWRALLDPQVLVATIPGCEKLEPLPSSSGRDHAYAMTVTAGVAAIKGTYNGTCALSDLHEHESLTMRLTGSGAPGTVDATVAVRFASPTPETTEIAYDADATVGGMVGGVGQRMLGSVAKRMAGEFFGNVGRAIGAPAPATATATAGEAMPTVYRDAVPGLAPRSQDDFLRGVAVGAGLVVLGVVVGSVFGRRR